MQCNVGGVDRAARTIIGLVLLAVGFLAPLSTLWQVIAFVLAPTALLTPAVPYCPLHPRPLPNSCHHPGSGSTTA